MDDHSRFKTYEYVGPPEIWDEASGATGVCIDSINDLESFLAARDSAERNEPFTYTVNRYGRMTLAPRRSEHVACAGGHSVLAAGEIGFARSSGDCCWLAEYISNQSVGYCPGLESWAVVARSLNRAEIGHGAFFTNPIIFRNCPHCESWNVVKEEFFVCSLCDSDLPVILPGERLAGPRPAI